VVTTSSAHAETLRTIGRPDRGAAGARVATLFASHGAAILGLCRVLLHNRHEAEDAVQQTFLSAYTSLLKGAEPRHPAAWLATIARNECRSRLEQRMRAPLRAVEEGESPLPDPVAAAAAKADLEALLQAIGELPRRQRNALLLREFSGLSYDELADALAVSAPTVESLLFRARRELRARLRPATGSAAAVAPLAAIREALARAIGGMPDPSAGALAGLATTTPLVAKVAAGVAVVAVAGGTVAAVDRGSGAETPVPARPASKPVRPAAEPRTGVLPAGVGARQPAVLRATTHKAPLVVAHEPVAHRPAPTVAAARPVPVVEPVENPPPAEQPVESAPVTIPIEAVPTPEPAPAAAVSAPVSTASSQSGSSSEVGDGVSGSDDGAASSNEGSGSTSSGPGSGETETSESADSSGPGSGSSDPGGEGSGESGSGTSGSGSGGHGGSGPTGETGGEGGSGGSGSGSSHSGSGSSGGDD
jgi:RNA polymerase sigma factor (sigma-70 family)